jgi:Leucine-rich repeat (LRR) protein
MLTSSFHSFSAVEFSCAFSLYNGPIPDAAFAGLTNLNYLDISDNGYTTSIPSSITKLPNLEFFYAYNTFLEGDLSFMIGMPKIIELWVDGTEFNSTIPTQIGALKTLESLSMTFCGLRGTIPTQMGLLSNMDSLWLYQNKLTGGVPKELGNLRRMELLHFEGNQLAGSMPNQICANRKPDGLITELGSDCDRGAVTCTCCTCCGGVDCENFV